MIDTKTMHISKEIDGACNILEEISPDIFPSFCMKTNVQRV